MCTAYEIGAEASKLVKRLLEVFTGAEGRLVRRMGSAPVMTTDRVVMMRWGFRRAHASAIAHAREERLRSWMWREAYETRRCLVPMRSFYEWTREVRNKQAWRFTDPEGGLLWVAGVWEEDREKGERCFAMLTTEANEVAAPAHERMPVVLGPGQRMRYLRGEMESFRVENEWLRGETVASPLKKSPPSDGQRELF